ncbi:MAG TPA: tetratricopeptide repeat protein [Candidatus Baltobacteraceae bacterium]|jgi:DNA-binding winged helix-turn-helix (wHTH) protein/tetratricopeptide (TPR) repeat protein
MVEPSWVYVFGPFRLDPARGLLTYGSEVVPLPERLFALLLVLIQANGSVVSRRELAGVISSGEPVSEANLSQHVYMLRRILGERAKDRLYIMTAHNKGFRFASPVSVVNPTAGEPAPVVAEVRDGTLLRGGFEAFRHYSRGSYLLERRTANTLRSSIDYFEAALAVSPDYSPALVGLARAHSYMAEYWYVPGSYAFPKAKAAIVRALNLEPSSATAHAALSNIMLFCEWDWREAKREIDRAVRLNPDSIPVCTNAVWYYECTGAGDRALSEAQHALSVEPSSPALQILLGKVLTQAGDYEKAIAYLSHLIENGPEFAIARRHRAQALILGGRPADAVVDLLMLPQDRAEDAALRLPLLARAYGDMGETERAKEIYTMLLEMVRTEFIVYWNLAMVAVGLGRNDEALDHLESAVACREPSLPLLKSSAWFAPIAKSARFKGLLRSIGH